MDFAAELCDAPEDYDDFMVWSLQQRWSDGLPIVPPTAVRVERMLGGTAWPGDHTVGLVSPLKAPATVEAIAINAVMAGCEPAAMPLLVAAVEAITDPAFNLFGVQATTHPCASLMLVSGPAAAEAGLNSSSGCFAPGSRGNATVGRALRLIQQNVGGAWPGETDRATQGTPAKYTFCFAENEPESPWEPYRMSLGFAESDTTVTVMPAEGPHNLNDHINNDAQGILFTFANAMSNIASNNAYCRNADLMVVLCPEHAQMIAASGYSRTDVQRHIAEHTTIRAADWQRGGMWGFLPQPAAYEAAKGNDQISVVDDPSMVHVVVAGGPGLHSSWMPTIGVAQSVTRRVSNPTD